MRVPHHTSHTHTHHTSHTLITHHTSLITHHTSHITHHSSHTHHTHSSHITHTHTHHTSHTLIRSFTCTYLLPPSDVQGCLQRNIPYPYMSMLPVLSPSLSHLHPSPAHCSKKQEDAKSMRQIVQLNITHHTSLITHHSSLITHNPSPAHCSNHISHTYTHHTSLITHHTHS